MYKCIYTLHIQISSLAYQIVFYDFNLETDMKRISGIYRTWPLKVGAELFCEGEFKWVQLDYSSLTLAPKLEEASGKHGAHDKQSKPDTDTARLNDK